MFTRGYIKSHVWTVNVYALRTAESPGLLREIPGPNIFPVIGDLTDWWSVNSYPQAIYATYAIPKERQIEMFVHLSVNTNPFHMF